MKLNKEFEPIRDWAKEKGIYDKATIEMQMIKLVEEMGELANGIIKKNDDEVKDAIGDCVVVLTNLAEMYGCGSIEDCINSAYGVIANRTGKMIDGVFVKESE